MDLNGIPLFAALRSKLNYLTERQQVIAQNVANASTPGFTPSDLKPFDQQPGMGGASSALTLAQPARSASASPGSNASIIAIPANQQDGSKSFVSQDAPDSETTLNGNQVVLEEQMMKMSDSQRDYDAAIGFYQKSLSLLHLAIQKPGG